MAADEAARAAGRDRLRSLRPALPFLLLALISLGALAFDLSLPARLPATQDYAEAAAFLRSHAQPGDAVQVWPPWLERARLFIGPRDTRDANSHEPGPVLAEEDLAHADFPGAPRVWILSLPGAPFSEISRAESDLRSRGATPQTEAMKFGPLRLTPWDLHAPALAADLIFGAQPKEWHEVQYVSRACKMMPVGGERDPGRARLEGNAGATLHVRAGIVGETAYNPQLAPVRIEVFAASGKLGDIVLNRTHDPQPAWLALDVPTRAAISLLAGNAPATEPQLQLELRASTTGSLHPPLCIAAWTTR